MHIEQHVSGDCFLELSEIDLQELKLSFGGRKCVRKLHEAIKKEEGGSTQSAPSGSKSNVWRGIVYTYIRCRGARKGRHNYPPLLQCSSNEQMQWNSYIVDTIGELHVGHYRGPAVAEGFL